MAIEEVSADELEAALAGGARLFDVREPSEYAAGHVDGAVLIPLGNVAERVEEMRDDAPVFVICKSGGRSMRACEILADEGIEAINVAGGTTGWTITGRPVVAGDPPT